MINPTSSTSYKIYTRDVELLHTHDQFFQISLERDPHRQHSATISRTPIVQNFRNGLLCPLFDLHPYLLHLHYYIHPPNYFVWRGRGKMHSSRRWRFRGFDRRRLLVHVRGSVCVELDDIFHCGFLFSFSTIRSGFFNHLIINSN